MLADVVTECERRTASCESPDDFRKVVQDVITERNQADVRLTEQGKILENALNQNSKVNDDNKYLRGIMNIILEQYRKEHTENVSLNEKVTLLRYELFGQKSEKSKYNSSSAETEANEAETGSKTEADNVNEVSGTAAGNADEVSASDTGKAPEGKVDLKDPVFDGVDREALSIVLAAKAADEAQAKAAEETEAGPPEGDAEKEGKGKGKGKGNGKGKENGKDKSKGEGNNKDKKGKDSDKDSNKDMDKQGNGEKDSGNEQDNENKYGKTPKGRERQREGGKKGHKRPGKRKKDLSGLPQTFELEDRTAEFNEKYGEGNWEIGGYTNTYTIEYISNACVRNVITPIPKVKVVEEEARENGARGTIHRDLVYPQMSPKVFPGSFLSPSLGAMIMAEKYAYGLPLNRIAKKLNNLGVPVDVMTLTNWHQYICDLYLRPLDDAHKALLPKQKYLHCDESPFTVVDNGRPPGAKSYVFCLTTGELLKNENPIVVFVASESRGKDVLREIFCDPETKCVITCDAFSIYPSFEKETDHRIIVVACMMHIRRYFKKAESLLLAAGLTEDAIRDTLEHKALVLIERIYREENKLKDLLPKDRVDARLEKIKPLFDKLFGLCRSFTRGPYTSDALNTAVQYALKQESFMRRYLYDGNIALDNGLCERFIRHFAVGRLNWLQCYSIEGSKDMGVAYGVMETALANGADPYTYMEYLLTKMPAILEGHDYNWVEDMEPWSDAFHAFEQEKKECRSRLAFSLPGLTPFEELPPVAAHTYLNNMRTGKQSSKVIAERERRRKAKLPVLSPKEEDKS